MLIGVRKRFVFVANTKTASTSIDSVLCLHAEIMRAGSPERKHMKLGAIAAEYGFLFRNPKFNFDTFFKFGVMREPLSWINSWYRYRRGNNVDSPLRADMTFEEFWHARDWNTQREGGKKYLQSNFFVDAEGKNLADVIIPYERMNDYIPEIFAALKVSGTLPRQNVSEVRETPLHLSPELRAEMLDFYAPDYEIYNQLDQINAVGMEKLREMTQK
ncbi:sulfotransferase family 2 domain-containing protein [Pararhodobacter sp.]|uniref:sulfotransferase family 2 domain-containing protein n=1 Tax=Pararhodobacter sp. TaxID=2127056 RepID=UPI002AFE9254|nr:sulfotransferase family 2 domain-containing protein [Pararhodobacter sp.]